MTDISNTLILKWDIVYKGSYSSIHATKSFVDIKRRIRLLLKPEYGAFVDDWIRDAQTRLEDELRLRDMEEHITDTISEGDKTIRIPDDYLELIVLYIIDNNIRIPLDDRFQPRKFVETFRNIDTTNNGLPRCFAMIGKTIEFDKYTDKDYEYGIVYFKRFPTLVEEDDINWWTENRSDLLFYASLVEAIPYIGEDKRMSLWQGKKDSLIEDLKNKDKKERRSGNGNPLYPLNVFLSDNRK